MSLSADGTYIHDAQPYNDGVRDRDVDRECDRRLPLRARNNVFVLPAVFGRVPTYSSLSSTATAALPLPALLPLTVPAYSVEPDTIEFFETYLFDTFSPVVALTTHLFTAQQC